jgi:hypothetical protein
MVAVPGNFAVVELPFGAMAAPPLGQGRTLGQTRQRVGQRTQRNGGSSRMMRITWFPQFRRGHDIGPIGQGGETTTSGFRFFA